MAARAALVIAGKSCVSVGDVDTVCGKCAVSEKLSGHRPPVFWRASLLLGWATILRAVVKDKGRVATRKSVRSTSDHERFAAQPACLKAVEGGGIGAAR